MAHKIMQKYGFREGQGLGKHEQGLSTALSVEKTSKRGGKIIVGDLTEKSEAFCTLTTQTLLNFHTQYKKILFNPMLNKLIFKLSFLRTCLIICDCVCVCVCFSAGGASQNAPETPAYISGAAGLASVMHYSHSYTSGFCLYLADIHVLTLYLTCYSLRAWAFIFSTLHVKCMADRILQQDYLL